MAQDLSSGWAGVDFEALFHAFPTPCVVLDTDLVIREPNAAFLTVTGRRRDHLVGRGLFTAFPELDPSNGAAANVERVLRRALLTGRPAVLGAQRYDISATEGAAEGEVRYWTTTAVPARRPPATSRVRACCSTPTVWSSTAPRTSTSA